MQYKRLSNGNLAIYLNEWNTLPADTTYPNCKAVLDDSIEDGTLLEVHDTSTGKITIYAQALEHRWFVR